MQKWRKEGRSISGIMKLTGRSKETVIKHSAKRKKAADGLADFFLKFRGSRREWKYMVWGDSQAVFPLYVTIT